MGSSLQAEAGVALEFGHIVEVELGALGEAIGGVARVATGDGCKHKVEMSLIAGGKGDCSLDKVLEVGEHKNAHINPQTQRFGAALLRYRIALTERDFCRFYWHQEFSASLSGECQDPNDLHHTSLSKNPSSCSSSQTLVLPPSLPLPVLAAPCRENSHLETEGKEGK